MKIPLIISSIGVIHNVVKRDERKIISIFEILKGFQFTGVRLAGLELPDLSPKKGGVP